MGKKLKIRNPEMRAIIEEIVGTLEAGPVAIKGKPVEPVFATGTLTVSEKPEAGDSFAFAYGEDLEVFTFVEEPAEAEAWEAGDFEIDLDGELTAVRAAIVAAINADSKLVTAGAFSAADATITAAEKGAAGNDIGTAGNFDKEEDGFAKETLEGGVDGTVGADGAIRFDDTNLYVSVGESTTTEGKWKKAALTT